MGNHRDRCSPTPEHSEAFAELLGETGGGPTGASRKGLLFVANADSTLASVLEDEHPLAGAFSSA
jgi:hypothetical protein